MVSLPSSVLISLLAAAPLGSQLPPSSTDVSGVWLGSLAAGGQNLRLQLHLETGSHGVVGCAMDSLDQHSFQIACTLAVKGGDITVQVPAVHGSWTGRADAGNRVLTGIWTQGASLPLVLTRQNTALQPSIP